MRGSLALLLPATNNRDKAAASLETQPWTPSRPDSRYRPSPPPEASGPPRTGVLGRTRRHPLLPVMPRTSIVLPQHSTRRIMCTLSLHVVIHKPTHPLAHYLAYSCYLHSRDLERTSAAYKSHAECGRDSVTSRGGSPRFVPRTHHRSRGRREGLTQLFIMPVQK